jgi:hypothetical protein
VKKTGPSPGEFPKLRLKECPVCGKKGSGPHWKTVYNKVHMQYTYPFFAHYAGTRGKTRIIEWCYIGKQRLIEAYQNQEQPR